jgi:signal transduction histidine kinase
VIDSKNVHSESGAETDPAPQTESLQELRSTIAELRSEKARLEDTNARLEAGVERAAGVNELMRRTAAAANNAASVEEALSVILPDIGEHLGAACAQAWLLDAADPDSLAVCGPFWGVDSSVMDVADAMPQRLAVDCSPLVAGIFEDRIVGWSNDIASTFGATCGAIARERGLRLAMVIPILGGDAPAGFIGMLFPILEERRKHIRELAQGVGAEIGRVVERVALQRRISDIGHEEQRRLGQELHDGVAQELVALKMQAELLARRLPPGGPQAERAASLVEGIARCLDQVRSLARGLVPVAIASGGLARALEELVARTETQLSSKCDFLWPDGLVVRDSELATNLYYIAQEALRNALRHGRADDVTIEAGEADGELVLSIRDNGCGFNLAETRVLGGAGLRIMAYRARMIGGSLEISSEVGNGTTVTCAVAHHGLVRRDGEHCTAG